jgi:hypothetical protein
MADAMQRMQSLHTQMLAAKTPAERQALMADHMKAMQNGMMMMQHMTGAACPPASASMPMRMDMMTMMMEMMMDRQQMGGMGAMGNMGTSHPGAPSVPAPATPKTSP